jgi:predicted ABC-type ATPase
MGRKTAIFLCGTAGSGKTTFRKTLPESYKVLNIDELKIPFDEYNKLIIDTIKSGVSFIYDGTCRDKRNMIPRMKLAKEHKYKVIFITLYVPLEVSLERVKKRIEQPVPEEVVKDIYKHLTNNIGKYINLDSIDEVRLYDNENEAKLIYHKKNGKVEYKSPSSNFYIEL